jgi:epoxyqueuosine reductase QueG
MQQKLTDEIVRFVSESPANCLPGCSTPYFDSPLTGFAAVADPLFVSYKEIIGAFHLTPGELFTGEFGDTLSAGTVISWILPITEAVRKSNRYQGDYPSREWSQTRNFGEMVNADLRRHVVAWLQQHGYRAVAPQLSPQWQEFSETPKGRASTWSERHAAYAAGLGTFSLNDALITEKGIAHRCGSVITDLVIEPSARVDRGYAWNCLYCREGSCGACIGRCPVGAISFAGHDKERCCEYVYTTLPAAVAGQYGVKATGCGLCQTRVPCESGIPNGKAA